MTSDNTTARPWFATKTLLSGGGGDINRRTVRGNDLKDDHEVCTLNPHMKQWTARHEADLNLMLRAVNAYDDLVAELENARAIIMGEAPQYGMALDRIDAALAKAGKKPDGR